MKKMLALICVLFLLSACHCASAQVFAPLHSKTLCQLVGGKTLVCAVSGYSFTDTDGYALDVVLMERALFSAEAVEAVRPGDILHLGWNDFTVKSVEKDEYGFAFKDEWDAQVFFYPNEDGTYFCMDDMEHTLWVRVLQFEAAAAEGFVYVDASEPDADPVNRAMEDVISGYEEYPGYFNEENTYITFDENGAILELKRVYSPWN